MLDEEEKALQIRVRGETHESTPAQIVERMLIKPTFVHFFSDGPTNTLDIQQLIQYLQGLFGNNFTFTYDGNIIQLLDARGTITEESLINQLAGAKQWAEVNGRILGVKQKRDLERNLLDRGPDTSIRDLASTQTVTDLTKGGFKECPIENNVYYEMRSLWNVYCQFLPDAIKCPPADRRELTIVITGRGLGEGYAIVDQDTHRLQGIGLHMRSGFAKDNLAIVSTTSLIEAQAGPDSISGIPRAQLFNDPVINNLIKGITLQMVMFGSEGLPTCSRSDLSTGIPAIPNPAVFCRLHDSHILQELWQTQVAKDGQPEFCNKHQQIFTLLQGKGK